MFSLALALQLLTPCNYLDTRISGCITGAGIDCAQGPFRDGETRQYLVQASAECPSPERPIPLGAQGLVVKVTVLEATGQGHLLLYDPTLEERPLASSINFQPGRITSNQVIVALGQTQGQAPGIPVLPDLGIYARVSGGGTAHVLVDFIGYWMPAECP